MPYDVADAESFFGRDAEVAACLDRLETVSVLVVAGPSGCGKSSLLRAGVVPALARRGRTVAVLTPGVDPEGALATALASASGTPVLIVDQLEELFTIHAPTEAARTVCARLAAYGQDHGPVVVAVRADHLAELAADATFARLVEEGLHLVSPLEGDELRAAIEGPAARAGLRLEHGLVDLRHPGFRGRGRRVADAVARVGRDLAATRRVGCSRWRDTGRPAASAVPWRSRPSGSTRRCLPTDRTVVRSVLLRLVAPSPDGNPFRSRVPMRRVAGDADRDRVLDILVQARLVTTDEDSVELAHEALARAWPRLRSWLDDDAAGHRILRHLTVAAEDWESLDRPPDELYRGARLEAALEWRATATPHLTDLEEAFLDAVDGRGRVGTGRCRVAHHRPGPPEPPPPGVARRDGRRFWSSQSWRVGWQWVSGTGPRNPRPTPGRRRRPPRRADSARRP